MVTRYDLTPDGMKAFANKECWECGGEGFKWGIYLPDGKREMKSCGCVKRNVREFDEQKKKRRK